MWRKRKAVVLKEMGNWAGAEPDARVHERKRLWACSWLWRATGSSTQRKEPGKYPRLFTEAEIQRSLWKIFPKHSLTKRDDPFQGMAKAKIRLLYSAL